MKTYPPNRVTKYEPFNCKKKKKKKAIVKQKLQENMESDTLQKLHHKRSHRTK